MTIHFTNPKRAGRQAVIKIIHPSGPQLWLFCGSSASRYAKQHQEAVKYVAGEFFAACAGTDMEKLFAACKGRVEAHRKINVMGAAAWESQQ